MIHRARINYVRWRAMARLSGASTHSATKEPTRRPVRKHDVVRAKASKVPEDLARSWSRLLDSYSLLDIVQLARTEASERDLEVVGRLYFALFERFGFTTDNVVRTGRETLECVREERSVATSVRVGDTEAEPTSGDGK